MKKTKYLNTIYIPTKIEKNIYQHWEKQGYFKINNTKKNKYCIIMPPPNITGNLHIGHAFQQTIMDILIRYNRMQGKNTLWQPGIDHAGIATQILVENKIFQEQKKTKNKYTTKELLNEAWKWKKKSHLIISKQIRRLGNSVNWEKERFTMDKKSSYAVKEAFIQLYKNKLIYQDKKIVNWDTKLKTAISDLEIEHKKEQGKIWYLRYPIKKENTQNSDEYIIVSTTRPETIFGDTGIAINPKDSRYKNFIGKSALLPLTKRTIPIIEDEYTKIEQGTGCIKITPAHDFNDYDIGKKHNLPIVNIFTKNGKIRKKPKILNKNNKKSNYEIPKIFQGLDRISARKLVIKHLNKLGLIVKEKQHKLTIPYSNKTNTIIEPMITNQWYLRTTSLAKTAIKTIKEKKIKFISKKYENIYFNWMKNIKDWCISRQLWWGHKIPIWYDNKNKKYIGYNEKYIRKQYNLTKDFQLKQDNDVLDTWFSSGLWTFSSLGWPKNTNTLRHFHPTNIIISGFDIIFFWISRMIMLTTYLIKDKQKKPEIPFKKIYITGLIRDEKGKKMSKSKGNIIDPLDIIDGISLHNLIKKRINNKSFKESDEKIKKYTIKQFPNGIKSYGADTLRFTLTSLASTHNDIHWDIKKLEKYKNFCNKLWNASKFVIIHTINKDCGFNKEKKIYSITDLWVITKINKLIKFFKYKLNHYRFDLASNALYEFTWNQFCNWYLEFTKITIKYGNEQELRGTRHTLITVLEILLRLLHPIIPFITEKIWTKIRKTANINGKTIMLQNFPKYNKKNKNISEYKNTEWIKKNITAIRNIRSEINIPLHTPLKLFIKNPTKEIKKRINENFFYIKKLAKISDITLLKYNEEAPKLSIIQLIDNTELFIPISSNIINKNIEINRIKKQIKKIEEKINHISKILETTEFSNNAPKKIIEHENTKLKLYKKQKDKLLKQYKILSNI
ncbi:MAG: valine--tRNA ligase [Candidatus Westeberhardia cardiocondylae]|nr:valine--tRNA ligase [Candidatus Westeberhardia cardiocondylae]